MNALIRGNRAASIAWLVLALLTLASWALGTGHGFGSDDHLSASVIIFVVAVVKIRVVGLYFMELREAPTPLRVLFEGYCVLLLGALVGMYLIG